jgi:hypothetical protein
MADTSNFAVLVCLLRVLALAPLNFFEIVFLGVCCSVVLVTLVWPGCVLAFRMTFNSFDATVYVPCRTLKRVIPVSSLQ